MASGIADRKSAVVAGQNLSEFGDALPPIFVKELRQGLRTNLFVWPFIVVQVAAIIALLMEAFKLGGWEAPFMVIVWVVFAGLLPLTLFGALRPELAGGRNVELLLLSNLSRWQIVLGKWGVASVLSNLMLVSLVPYWLVRYLIGNIGNFSVEFGVIGSLILANAAMNAVVIGASGFKNYVGRAFFIALSGLFGFLTVMATAPGIFRLDSTTPVWQTGLLVISVLIAVALVVALNLQLGRAKLRLFENPLDPPSSALIIVLIVCTPIMVGITLGIVSAISAVPGISLGQSGVIMTLLLLVLALLIDPGPGKKNRRWAQA